MEQYLERAKKIRLLLLDVDGVLTDGRIIYDSRGRDLKFFDVYDGLGVYLLRRMGIPTILISAKASSTIKWRSRDMQVVAVYKNVWPKTKVLGKILNKYKVVPQQICFVGDDLIDLCLMKKVGLPVAVANACEEVKDAAYYITKRCGGRGAVREVIELILKSQGRWEEALRFYQ
jgi:3-deoxy-D-manno-octulosonate 8-phosphate phosphatase (KDO 8-P phosphatase)